MAVECVNVTMFHSWLRGQVSCYASVIQETCNPLSANINMLKTTVYYAELLHNARTWCQRGESVCAKLLHNSSEVQRLSYPLWEGVAGSL